MNYDVEWIMLSKVYDDENRFKLSIIWWCVK
jgi:hypothetical protein